MKAKWLVAFLCIILLGAGFYAPQQVFAAPALHMDAEIGINQRVKQGMPTVLNLTITNNGDTFSGDLVVDAEVAYNLGSALVYPMDLAAGETKNFTIYLDGFSDRYMYGNSNVPDMFYFYEGGIEKGKKLKYEGNHFVTPRILSTYTEMMLVVTTRLDEVSAVDRLESFITDELEMFYTDKKNSPYLAEDYRALKMLYIR